jgi:hypothetical protein
MTTNVRLLFYHIVEKDLIIRFLVCVLISLLLWTAKGFVLIRFDKKIISEGYTILGLRILTLYRAEFTGFEKIYINYVSSGTSTHFNQRAPDDRMRTAAKYKAFLKTCEGDKFCVAEHGMKENVVQKVTSIGAAIKCPVYDNTAEGNLRS